MDAIYPLTLYFDGSCQLCSAEIRNLQIRNAGGLLRFVDISPAGFNACPPGTDRDAMMRLIHAQRADGVVLRGVEVFRLAYSAVGMPWVARLTRMPVVKSLSEWMYPLLARHRYSLPAAPIRWLFERSLRRAAERSAQRASCDAGQCRVGPAEEFKQEKS